jgi:hypothetical protein
MISGSFASSIQGEPRLTHDIDFVIQVHRKDIPAILREFKKPDYYVSETAIYEAFENKSSFNVIDVVEGDKIDFWLLMDDAYDKMRFSRRKEMVIWGEKIFVSAPEDTILKKLHWSKLCGGSQKQEFDARKVFEHNQDVLDREYLHTWSAYLGVEDQLKSIETTPL